MNAEQMKSWLQTTAMTAKQSLAEHYGQIVPHQPTIVVERDGETITVINPKAATADEIFNVAAFAGQAFRADALSVILEAHVDSIKIDPEDANNVEEIAARHLAEVSPSGRLEEDYSTNPFSTVREAMILTRVVAGPDGDAEVCKIMFHIEDGGGLRMEPPGEWQKVGDSTGAVRTLRRGFDSTLADGFRQELTGGDPDVILPAELIDGALERMGVQAMLDAGHVLIGLGDE